MSNTNFLFTNCPLNHPNLPHLFLSRLPECLTDFVSINPNPPQPSTTTSTPTLPHAQSQGQPNHSPSPSPPPSPPPALAPTRSMTTRSMGV
ncbi:hypothetical protein V2J09_001278 [Rumex salicifolius]